MDKGILKVNENFETTAQRNVLRIIAIHVDDLLIPEGFFTSYIPKRMGWKFDADSNGGNKATYLVMKIEK